MHTHTHTHPRTHIALKKWFGGRYPQYRWSQLHKYERHLLVSQDYLLQELMTQGYTPGTEVKVCVQGCSHSLSPVWSPSFVDAVRIVHITY